MASLSSQVADLESDLALTKYERDTARALLLRMLKQYGGQLSGDTLNPFTDEEVILYNKGKVFLDENFVVKMVNI